MPQVNIFDPLLQKEVPFTLEVDAAGEIVATSTESTSFVKFPAGLTREQFDAAVAEHKEANEGMEYLSQEEAVKQAEELEASRSLVDSFNRSKSEE